MSVYVHGFLNPTLGLQDGTQITEGTGLTPIAGDAQSGRATPPIRVGIRMVPDIPAGTTFKIDSVSNSDANYTFSTSDARTDAYIIFNNVSLLSSNFSGIISCADGWVGFHSNTGGLLISGFNLSSADSGWGVKAFTVKDGGGAVVYTLSGISDWGSSGSTKTFMLPVPVRVVDLVFTVDSGSASFAVPKIQLLAVGDTIPTINTLTVQASGTNADKWAFAKAGQANIASTCTLTTTQAPSFSSGDVLAALVPLTDGVVDSGFYANLYSGASLTFTLPVSKAITGIVVKATTHDGLTYIQSGLMVLCDSTLIATNPSTLSTLGSVWSPVIIPTVCSSVTIAAPNIAQGSFISEIEIYVEDAPADSDYSAYGSPLAINGTPALDTTNTVIYAKREALSSERSYTDTSTTIQLTCS